MNDEYISRDELRKHLADCMTAEFFDSDMKKAVVGIDVYVENMPAADVQPVKHGEWKYYKNTGIFDIHKCSVCATPFELPMDIVPSSVFCFCPHCGARMDGESK